MPTNFTAGKFQAFDSDGNPLAGGRVYTYAAGTLTPLVTHTTYGQTQANTNPVRLNDRGEAAIWLTDAAYRIVVHDVDDVPVPGQDFDNINVQPAAEDTLAEQLVDLYGTALEKTVTTDDGDSFGEDIRITDPTGKSGYSVRLATYTKTGNLSSGINNISDALISRYQSISNGSGWGRWDVMQSPLGYLSGYTGAPTVAQSFALVASEVNPQNRTAAIGSGFQVESRLYTNPVSGEQMVAETQDFTSLLGSYRIGYDCGWGYMISRSPYTSNVTNKHAKFFAGLLVNPNSIGAGGAGISMTGYRAFPTAVAVSAAGSGYVVGDIVTLNSTLDQNINENTQVKVLAVNGSGGITSCELWNAGGFVTPASLPSPQTSTGGTGTGATFTVTMSTTADAPRAAFIIGGTWGYGLDFAYGGSADAHSRFTSSAIRLPNNSQIAGIDAANVNDIALIGINTSNQPVLGGKRVVTRAAYTPTFTADAGTFTTVTLTNARYSEINGIVHGTVNFQMVNKGTGTGAINMTLPLSAAAYSAAGSGVNLTDGIAMAVSFNSGGSTLRVSKYDGTDPIVDSKFYSISFTYEAA